MYQDAQPHNEDEQQELLASRLQTFGARLSKLAGEQAAARAQVEQRWLEDIRQYHGEYTDAEKARLANSDGSQMSANVTRNKTNGAEARLQDMLFPTDDRNFALKHSPVPEIPGMDGTTLAQLKEAAATRAEAMQTEIDDQLNESRYSIKARDVIHDAAQIGTSILKGPVIVGRARKSWRTDETGMSVLSVTESFEPAVERVDPWNFYPDMSASTIDEAEFVFERHYWTKKQLREFAKLPDVSRTQLRALVRSGSDTQDITKNPIDDIRAITGVDVVKTSSRFEVWEYHGPISKAELVDAMCSCEQEIEQEELDELDDELDAVVFFSATMVLKVVINPMDTEDHPYAVFNWEKDESSIFGFGVPYLMRNPQKMMNAALRMLMDNAGASVSDIIVANRHLIEPADGSWSSIPGKKKLYYLNDKARSVNEAFASFTMPNHQAELAAIFTMARQLADEETNLPLIAQGEQAAHVTKTSSGMAMLMNSANIVLRRAVKNWDDDVTRPLIGRFYDWNMQFSDDESIKGDFAVDARGSGALLVRERQQESLMMYANISGNNPELAMRRDWAGLDEQMARALEVPYEKLTLSEEEVEQKRQAMAQQPPDPATMKLQMDAQLQQQQMQLDQQRIQLEMQYKHQALAQERELKLADIASREGITIAQLQANTGIKAQQEQTKRDIAAVLATHKQTETQLKAENLARGFDTYGG